MEKKKEMMLVDYEVAVAEWEKEEPQMEKYKSEYEYENAILEWEKQEPDYLTYLVEHDFSRYTLPTFKDVYSQWKAQEPLAGEYPSNEEYLKQRNMWLMSEPDNDICLN